MVWTRWRRRATYHRAQPTSYKDIWSIATLKVQIVNDKGIHGWFIDGFIHILLVRQVLGKINLISLVQELSFLTQYDVKRHLLEAQHLFRCFLILLGHKVVLHRGPSHILVAFYNVPGTVTRVAANGHKVDVGIFGGEFIQVIQGGGASYTFGGPKICP